MILYHGTSDREIQDFTIISREKYPPDFGDGIYFTSNFQQAKEWSCYRSELGAVYCIDIDLEGLKGIELKDNELFFYASYLNRIDLRELVFECLEELDGKDYVYGSMIGSPKEFVDLAEEFNEGNIDLSELIKKTRIKRGYDQYCFRSIRAVNRINDSNRQIIYTKKIKDIVE